MPVLLDNSMQDYLHLCEWFHERWLPAVLSIRKYRSTETNGRVHRCSRNTARRRRIRQPANACGRGGGVTTVRLRRRPVLVSMA